jgi:tetratricopeptide (TPR) repeat protein
LVQRTSEALSFDPYALTLTWFALTLAYLGYTDQARSQMHQALSEARRLRQAHTLAHVLLFADWLDWIIGVPMSRSDEIIALTTEHGFPHYLGWGLAYRGWCLLESGQPQESVAPLTQALVDLREGGNSTSTPMLLTWLAQAHAALGQSAEEQRYLVEAVRVVEATEERVSEAELLHRVPGDLLKARGDRTSAERSYHQAITIAKRQGAKVLELRVCDQPRPLVARTRRGPRGSSVADPPLQLVHGRVRRTRPAGGQDTAGAVEVTSERPF